MGLYTKLSEDIQDVDVIIAGGKREFDQFVSSQMLKMVARWDSGVYRSRKTCRSRSQPVHSGYRGRPE